MSLNRPSYSLRAALLGAVALAALGAVAVETSVAPVSAADTSTQTAATAMHAPAGPASFADVVDRVSWLVFAMEETFESASKTGLLFVGAEGFGQAVDFNDGHETGGLVLILSLAFEAKTA